MHNTQLSLAIVLYNCQYVLAAPKPLRTHCAPVISQPSVASPSRRRSLLRRFCTLAFAARLLPMPAVAVDDVVVCRLCCQPILHPFHPLSLFSHVRTQNLINLLRRRRRQLPQLPQRPILNFTCHTAYGLVAPFGHPFHNTKISLTANSKCLSDLLPSLRLTHKMLIIVM